MKRCPQCRRDYYDDSLLYCLDDGNALVDGPACLEFAPDFFFTHWALGVCNRQLGRMEEAIEHLEQAVAGSGVFALKGDLGVTLALAGRESDARVILAELDAESKRRYVSPQWSSVIYAALGDKDRALDYLEKAWEVRSVQLLWLAVDPSFDSLREEPEFLAIFNKMKIPTSSTPVGAA